MVETGKIARFCRSCYRSAYLLLLLIAASIDGHIRRPRIGAEGAVWIHGWCRRIVNALDIVCDVTGRLPAGGAVVSNHLSYLDILLYSAATPCIMVAKKELRSWPLLGWLTAQAGTVYVQRSEDVGPSEQQQSHDEVNGFMSEAFASGLPVLFFPEGTTTDGSAVLPFRRGLFHSVLNNCVPLRTAAIRFELNSQSSGATVGNEVCFIGEAFFAPHLFRCLGLRGLSAQIRYGDEVLERADRFALSEAAHTRVANLYEELECASIITSAEEVRYQVGAIEAL